MSAARIIDNTRIETVYTYAEWKRVERKRAERKRQEIAYYLCQKCVGLFFALLGCVSPVLFDGDGTATIVLVPFGLYLMLTRKKIMEF